MDPSGRTNLHFFFPAANALRGQTPEWTEQKHLWHAGIWKPATRQRVSPHLLISNGRNSFRPWVAPWLFWIYFCPPSFLPHANTHTDVDASVRGSNEPGSGGPFPGPVGSAVQVSQQSSAEWAQCRCSRSDRPRGSRTETACSCCDWSFSHR